MMKKLYLLINILILSLTGLQSQNENLNIEPYITNKLEIPEGGSVFKTFDFAEPDVVFTNYEGGIYMPHIQKWLIPPNPNFRIKSFDFDVFNKSFLYLSDSLDSTYLIEIPIKQKVEAPDTLLCLGEGQFKIECSGDKIILNNFNEKGSTFYLFKRQSLKLSKLFHVNDLIFDFEFLGDILVYNVKGKVFMANLETLELLELFAAKDVPLGFTIVDGNILTLSYEKGVLILPLRGADKAVFFNAKISGNLFFFNGSLILFDLASNNLFFIDFRKIFKDNFQ